MLDRAQHAFEVAEQAVAETAASVSELHAASTSVLEEAASSSSRVVGAGALRRAIDVRALELASGGDPASSGADDELIASASAFFDYLIDNGIMLASTQPMGDALAATRAAMLRAEKAFGDATMAVQEATTAAGALELGSDDVGAAYEE